MRETKVAAFSSWLNILAIQISARAYSIVSEEKQSFCPKNYSLHSCWTVAFWMGMQDINLSTTCPQSLSRLTKPQLSPQEKESVSEAGSKPLAQNPRVESYIATKHTEVLRLYMRRLLCSRF